MLLATLHLPRKAKIVRKGPRGLPWHEFLPLPLLCPFEFLHGLVRISVFVFTYVLGEVLPSFRCRYRRRLVRYPQSSMAFERSCVIWTLRELGFRIRVFRQLLQSQLQSPQSAPC